MSPFMCNCDILLVPFRFEPEREMGLKTISILLVIETISN
jgi:hypothetical protein